MNQLSIFEMPIETMPFEITDNVRIFISKERQQDVESFYYLNDFKNVRGKVLKVVEVPSLQYEVDFNGKLGIVYHDELKYW